MNVSLLYCWSGYDLCLVEWVRTWLSCGARRGCENIISAHWPVQLGLLVYKIAQKTHAVATLDYVCGVALEGPD